MLTNKNARQAQCQTESRRYLRLPKPGTLCPITGLTRSYINLLVLPCKANGFNPPVRSFCLKQPGRKTGVRLVDINSLFDYIERHEQGAAA